MSLLEHDLSYTSALNTNMRDEALKAFYYSAIAVSLVTSPFSLFVCANGGGHWHAVATLVESDPLRALSSLVSLHHCSISLPLPPHVDSNSMQQKKQRRTLSRCPSGRRGTRWVGQWTGTST